MEKERADYKTSGEGYAIIINIVDFSPPCQLPTRHGSEKDADELRDMLVERDFIVHSFSDCTASDIRNCLAAIGKDKEFFKRFRSLFVFILSHGYQNGIYASDGIPLSFNEIQSHLMSDVCPAFRNKPKLIFFQCCRLTLEGPDDSVRVMDEDIHLSFAGQLYLQTYRDTMRGAYYIQCLLEVIKDKGDEEDLVSLLTMVNEKMVAACLPCPDNRGSLRDKVYIKRERRSKMILRREDCHKDDGELDREIVTSASCTSVSSASIPRPKRATWPVIRKPCSGSPPDSYGIEIEKPFEKSENLSASLAVCLPQPLSYSAFSRRGGLALLITTNNTDTSHCDELASVLEKVYHHSVLILHNVIKSCLYRMLEGLGQVELESFVLTITSIGDSNRLFDSLGEEISMEELLQRITTSVPCNALVLFQTINAMHQKDIEETAQLSTCSSIRVYKSHVICGHISTSSSILSQLAQNVKRYRQHNLFSVASLLEVTCRDAKGMYWYKTLVLNVDYDLCVMGSSIQDIHLLTLMCSTNMALSLGRQLNSMKDRVYPLVQGMPNTSTLTQHIIEQVGAGREELSQCCLFLQGLLMLETQVLSNAEAMVKAMIETASNDKLTELLEECLPYVQKGESIIEMMSKAMMSDQLRWYHETLLKEREQRTLNLIKRIQAHLYCQPTPEEGVGHVVKATNNGEPVASCKPKDVTFTGLVQDDLLFNEERREEAAAPEMTANAPITFSASPPLPPPSSRPAITASTPSLDVSSLPVQHLLLRMVENDGFIEIVPAIATLREVEDGWMELSYRDSDVIPADSIIIFDDVETDEGFVDIVPVPVIFHQREDDWTEMTVMRIQHM